MTDPSPAGGTEIERTLGLGAAKPHRGRRWPWWFLAVALLVGAVAALWTLRDQGDGVEYKTQDASRGDLTVTVTATGNLQPTNEYNVGIEVSGTLAHVDVDFNDRVKVGQVLARLDTTKLEAQVLQSRAAVASSKAGVAQAQATVLETRADLAKLRHVRELSGGKVPAAQDLIAAEAAVKRAEAAEASARAQVAQAEATLKVNETDLSKAVVYSPTDGVVLTR
ncbi:MAG: biotin/lipoyl-binding protein, partial [Myxococcales bacterium]|nr:biotin/lipoyl-binding protein [Myxococcales bacterium]